VTLSLNNVAIAVADGLGGHFGGAYASTLAVSEFRKWIPEGKELKEIALDIHEAIRREQAAFPERKEMATTFTAVMIYPNALHGVHCGDTRVVVIREGGIKRLTTDHTEAQRLVEAGKLSRSNFSTYPRRNILDSALGIKGPLRLDVFDFLLKPADRIVLTTDGVHNKIRLRELFEISQNTDTVKELIDAIVAEVERRSPEDNYTVASAFIT
jgi:protein phosphatase